MSKIIPEIPKEVYDWFDKSDPMFLVKGIRKQQNHPSQPPQYATASFHLSSLDELHIAIFQEGLTRFKVYEVGGVFSHEAQLRNDADKANRERTEKQERELYEKLKLKFESKMAVVE